MSIVMMEVLKKVKDTHNLDISMRVGMHFGEILGTVMGNDCLR